jgi:predicted PurR-regulated permease PerM
MSDQAPSPASTHTDWQRAFYIALTILAWLVVVLIVGWLLSHVAKTIVILILSAVVAFALTPLVSLLARWLPRTLALALAYLCGFAVIFGFGALLIVTAAAQLSDLSRNLPRYIEEGHQFVPQITHALGPFGVTTDQVQRVQQQLIAHLQTLGTQAAQESVGFVSGFVSTIVDLVLILILSIYLTANGQRIRVVLGQMTPLGQRWQVSALIAIVNRVIGGYVRGTLAMAVLIGTLVSAGMLVLGVHYAVLLGVLAFFLQFVPLLGVFISGAVCVAVALLQSWKLALVVLGYFVGVHILEGDLVGPRVLGRAIGIHPATALVALVAGTELFGIWGALFGAPLAGLIQAIGIALWQETRGGKATALVEGIVEEEKAEVRRSID